MMVYVGQTRATQLVRRLWELGLGECTVRGELPPRRHPWFFDNGAFGDWKAGRPFDADQFRADIERISGAADRPDFIVVPDIVAGGRASLDFSLSYVDELVKLRAPLYLAVQDGMGAEIGCELEPFAGLFVGGSLPWKIQTGAKWVEIAHLYGKRCHIGRCGTADRLNWARRIGADSIDSSLPLWSEENLETFLRALNSKQADLPLGAAA